MTPAASENAEQMPEGLLLAYYGDDFTGSTDVLEVMAGAGLPSALFLQPPSVEELARFGSLRCVGVAGTSRSRDTSWMDRHLPQVFDRLAALRPAILQYKVCSTFDSSPQIGSIGRAVDLGSTAGTAGWVPVIVGAPRLRRYQAFGHLFAAAGDGGVYLLDRHPTMSRHPVTPMLESDLRRHLSRQTLQRIELIDLNTLHQGTASQALATLTGGDDVPVVLIDVLDEATMLAAGELAWTHRGRSLFSASSSGLAYALVAQWRRLGWLPECGTQPCAGRVQVVAAVSGSCSPVTAQQIRWARTNGFATFRLDLHAALGKETAAAEVERCVALATAALETGQSAIVFSAEGPEDPCVQTFDRSASAAGLAPAEASRQLGGRLAAVMDALLKRRPLQRFAVAGGDSSGEVMGGLGVQALSALAPLSPGAPLCRTWSANPARDGLQVVLKGGQMGRESFFGDLLLGREAP